MRDIEYIEDCLKRKGLRFNQSTVRKGLMSLNTMPDLEPSENFEFPKKLVSNPFYKKFPLWTPKLFPKNLSSIKFVIFYQSPSSAYRNRALILFLHFWWKDLILNLDKVPVVGDAPCPQIFPKQLQKEDCASRLPNEQRKC